VFMSMPPTAEERDVQMERMNMSDAGVFFV
jgi:hypothetical protein